MHDTDDPIVRHVREVLRAPVRLRDGFDARVMDEVRAGSGPRAGSPRRALRWLTRSRTVRVSPLIGLAAAAGVAGLLLVGQNAGRESDAQPKSTPPVGLASSRAPLAAHVTLHAARFSLTAPAAASVSLVGDFNDWEPSAAPLTRGPGGVWTTAVPLPPGRYEYAFVVDGSRVIADPTAPLAEAGDFGAPNSLLTVGAGSRP